MADTDETKSSIYQSNISRAFVTGKVPSARGSNAPRTVKHGKMTRDRKQQVKRLKKRGLISDRAASRQGL